MSVVRNYERFTHTRALALGAIDQFAAARINKDEIPPVLGEVTFLITGRLTPPPAATYEPPFEFLSWTNRSGFFLFSGEVRTPARPGTVMLGPGQYHCRVESDYYQTLEFDLVWPPMEIYDKAKDLKLVPGPAYPFPEPYSKQRELATTLLRGSLFTPGGEPIENVKIELTAPALPARFEGFLECLTDKRGGWILSFIEKEHPDPGDALPVFASSRIHIGLPGAPYDVDLAIEPGKDNSLRQTALRGRVTKPGGAPLSGVTVITSVAAGESISKSDGQWSFYFEQRQLGGPVTVTATNTDGLTNTALTQIVPGVTVVVPAIELS